MRICAQVCSLLLAALLSACGSGDSAEDESKTLQVTNVRVPTINVDMYSGHMVLPDIAVRFDFSGDPARMLGQTFHVVVEDSNSLFVIGSARLTINYGTGRDHLIEVAADNGVQNRTRPPGVLQNAARMRLCYDAACNNPLAGASTISVPYTVKVRAGADLSVAAAPVRVLFGETPPEIFVSAVIPPEVTVSAFGPSPAPCPFMDCSGNFPIIREVRSGADAGVTIAPKMLPVGSYVIRVSAEATGVTSTGTFPASSSVRTMAFDVLPNPAVSMLARPARVDLLPESGVWRGSASLSVLADGGQTFRPSRIVYTPPGPGGNLDAGGQEWVSSLTEAAGLPPPQVYTFEVRGCVSQTVPPIGAISCLPGGRYEAVIYMTDGSREVAVPVTMTLLGVPPA